MDSALQTHRIMNESGEEVALTPEGRSQACEHWDALMFAPCRTTLEAARLALSEAPLPVQLAVMSDINAKWLREYEPSREENPFADVRPHSVPLPPASTQEDLLVPEDVFQTEKLSQSFTSSRRLSQWIKNYLTPSNRTVRTHLPLQKAATHH